MTHMRRSAIFLFAIAFAALFFDRFVAPGRVGWELNPGLCLVAFSIVLVLIALPRLSRLSVFLWLSLWLGSYEFGRLIFLHEGLRPGGLSAHALGIETAFLAISIVLGHRFAQGLLDFEGAIRDVVLPATDKRIRRADEVDEEIQNILYRSRRYQRPLSLLVVEPDEETSRATLHRAVAEVQSALVGSYAISRLARVVCDTVRRSDLVFRHPAGLAILCQETNAQGTAELVGRVQRAAGVHGVSVAWGIASFPEEALTFDQLVHQAATKIRDRSWSETHQDLVSEIAQGFEDRVLDAFGDPVVQPAFASDASVLPLSTADDVGPMIYESLEIDEDGDV